MRAFQKYKLQIADIVYKVFYGYRGGAAKYKEKIRWKKKIGGLAQFQNGLKRKEWEKEAN